METMDEDTNAARITTLREKRREHLRQRLASLHAEHALLENELTSLQGSPGVVEAADVPIENRVMCKHFCAHHTSLMDPAVWRNLPEEVLQMVFARLPLLRIVSLQCLSKAWRWNVTAVESGFRRLCVGFQKPNVFALADEAHHSLGVLDIKMFDVEAQKWHAFEMTIQPEFACATMAACDGGLVCFVSREKVANPLHIVVLNPLTKEYKVLPTLPSSLNKAQPQMVQLIMDRETKCYKVVVVGKKNRRTGTVLAKVYSSATGKWSNPDTMPEHLVFGYHFRWRPDSNFDGHQLLSDRVGPCAYACHEAEFLKFGEYHTPCLHSCNGYALVKDRLFVLHNETRHYSYGSHYSFVLSEYLGQRSSPYWVGVRVHDCTPLERPDANRPLSEKYWMVLHACRDSLIITVQNMELGAFKLVRIFLYDLSTYKWQEIPAVPGSTDELNQPMIQAAMCELHWDAVP